ncbi:unnamed protein product [Boreogadus saida]
MFTIISLDNICPFTLFTHQCGVWRLKPSLEKYASTFTLDPNTAHRYLALSDENRKVMLVGEEQSYPDHPERFDSHCQVLWREGLTGRCYWEVDREGGVTIAVVLQSNISPLWLLQSGCVF